MNPVEDSATVELRKRRKQSELRQAQFRLSQLAALRQRAQQKVPAVVSALLAAREKGLRVGLARLEPHSALAEREASPDPLDRLEETAHQQQHQAKLLRESIKASVRARVISSDSATARSQQHAQRMLAALAPANAQERNASRLAANAKVKNQALQQQELRIDAAKAERAREAGVASEKQSEASHEQSLARRQTAGQSAEQTRLDASQHHAQMYEQAQPAGRTRRALLEAEQTVPEQASSRRPRQDAVVGHAGQLAWLRRLQAQDLRHVQAGDLHRLVKKIDQARELARLASAAAGKDLTHAAQRMSAEAAHDCEGTLSPKLARLPSLRDVQKCLKHLRQQAIEAPRLTMLADQMQGLLTDVNQAHRDARKAEVVKENRPDPAQPAQDDASWMRSIDQYAQALSGVLGPDAQAKALQALLGNDLTRLARLSTAGNRNLEPIANVRSRLERRTLQLERWAVREYGAHLADQLREAANRERHRVDEAALPPAVAAGATSPAQGAADNAYLKQVQSL